MYHWCLNGLIRVYTHPSDTAIKQQQGTLCINTHTHTHTHTHITAIWCSILPSENTRSKAPVSHWQPTNNNSRYPSIRLTNNLASSCVWCIERKIIRKVLRRKTLTHAQLPRPSHRLSQTLACLLPIARKCSARNNARHARDDAAHGGTCEYVNIRGVLYTYVYKVFFMCWCRMDVPTWCSMSCALHVFYLCVCCVVCVVW